MKGLTDIDGVFGAGIFSGLKQDSSSKDLAYIYVPNAVGSAAVFTQHLFPAPSVVFTKKNSQKYTFKAVVINSGNAHAGIGEPDGMNSVKKAAKQVADRLNISIKEVAVASTGVIGVPLPMDLYKNGLDRLLSDVYQKDSESLAQAILTTDLVTKSVFKEKKIGKKTFQVAGITKGSGMIAPNMATTLTFLVTNADLNNQQLQPFLECAIHDSYNMLSVDTDTSTNDMVVIFATGEHKFSITNKQDTESFQELLTDSCVDLAKQIAKDGEGATTVINAKVSGAASNCDARTIAKQVVDSPLVKTAIYGADPNWGRIVMAMGKNPSVKLNPKKVSIFIGPYQLMKSGEAFSFDRELVSSYLKDNDEVDVMIDLGLGRASALAYGCDLTHGYIDINTEYS
tara:strand:+ start:7244 stop:8437 length:1194 start_codon:yes stop_codon:yes gene_type:complete